ncbi:MSHA biogenesis protein MshP [Paraferrimonas haliotis]|uniref:MSHA biogenesis protein MshP n=1 Tax=Paraferrimonas haliotis TaxID=2013866 RepID=A0AA37WVN4_9GAMM|nr:MSHA biogenesis protein MshP [Paraferrimonas haliotis]GLS82352.1 MSHA biogenesis protein MshP [Paraferrimonas haliotis]
MFPKSQRGASLILAIFIITVMAVLAAALLRVNQDSAEALTLEVWGARALASANSGADRALSQLFPISGAVPVCANVSTSWNLDTDVGSVGFNGCSVTIGCSQLSQSPQQEFRIQSTAVCESGNCNGDAGSCLRVSRSVEVGARYEP